MKFKSLVIIAALGLVPLAAHAETDGRDPATDDDAWRGEHRDGRGDDRRDGRHGGWEACRADVHKFCLTADRSNRGSIRICLENHVLELSPACTAARAERAERASPPSPTSPTRN